MSDGLPPGERLMRLVSEILRIPVASLSDDLNMQESSTWDSLSHMELIATIEDEFDIELTTDEIVAMTSIYSIKSIVFSKAAP